jgi:hypothetical protein
MKELSWIVLVASIIVVWAVLSKSWEPFVPEFLENSNVKRTAERKDSSYEQETNHVKIINQLGLPPIQGLESKLRVNMFNSFVP